MTDDDYGWHYKEVERHCNETIEKCARAIECHDGFTVDERRIAAAVIRELKSND